MGRLELARHARKLALWCGIALFTPACSGTGDGGTGDQPSDPLADDQQTLVRDVVKPASWLDPSNTNSVDCDSPDPRRVDLTDLTVVAIDDFDENDDGRTGNVYAVQTPGKKGLRPYDGITLRTPSFTPPDLRLFTNDVIDASGNFVEFLGPPGSNAFGACKTLPQLEGTAKLRRDGSNVEPYLLVPAVAPEGEDRWAVLKSYEAARPFIGMLVRLENVQVTTVSNNNGAIEIPINVDGGVQLSDVPKITNELYDMEATGPAIPDNSTFASITGVITYFYQVKIAPRSGADFVRQ